MHGVTVHWTTATYFINTTATVTVRLSNCLNTFHQSTDQYHTYSSASSCLCNSSHCFTAVDFSHSSNAFASNAAYTCRTTFCKAWHCYIINKLNSADKCTASAWCAHAILIMTTSSSLKETLSSVSISIDITTKIGHPMHSSGISHLQLRLKWFSFDHEAATGIFTGL